MNKPLECMSVRQMVSWTAMVVGLGLLAGCDSRPAAESAKSSPPPPVQGELIQPTVTTTAAPASVIGSSSVVSNASTNISPVISPAGPVLGSLTPSPTNLVAATSEPPKLVDGFLGVGFDRLSAFNFEVTDDILQSSNTNAAQVASRTAEQIPQTVMSYDQKRIALKGFMLPLKVEGGKVTEMLIMRDQSMCCYGAVPKINEWVSVKMLGEGVRPIMDQAITLYGKLYVGEMRENGYLVGIYRMDGERIDGPAEN
jgi:hypothetical protein